MKVNVIVLQGSAVLHSKDKVERCAGVGRARSESCSIVVGKDGQQNALSRHAVTPDHVRSGPAP